MTAAPDTVLEVVQAAIEDTAGTAVAATHVVDHTAPADLDFGGKVIRIRNSGSRATSHRSYLVQKDVKLGLSFPATFDRLPWWLNFFLAPVTSGTGATAPYTWAFTTISDTTDNLASGTFEVGGRDTWPDESQVAGCRGLSLEIDMKLGDVWRCKAELIGKTHTPQAKTSALTAAASLVDILTDLTKVYIDPTTIGSTQMTGRVISANVKMALGMAQRHTMDGAVTPYRVGFVGNREVTAKIVAEFDSDDQYDAWDAQTLQKVRLAATGPSLGGSNYGANLDLYGTWEAVKLGDDGGVRTMELDLTGEYDSTAGSDIEATILNNDSVLPGEVES